ncbi:hypothetical protein W822_15610 [Advenella kashmirensis W13003]|uniref:Uncharacterized protein n=2 Tax=Advenella kashmirensis TaxID=310575 RepID=V8QSW3_9BURK|nr:hypothetical protein W822_15610 [Advenella kashmirensis W13003]
MLWFSSNQAWEPTATKMVRDALGNLKNLTFEEQFKLMGCVRFGLDADDGRLLDWRAACKHARTPRKLREAMERLGARMGAFPGHWFATPVYIPLIAVSYEVWDGNQWLPGSETGFLEVLREITGEAK